MSPISFARTCPITFYKRDIARYANITNAPVTFGRMPPGLYSIAQSGQTMTVRVGVGRRLNAKIRRHRLPFYQLVQMLDQETVVVDIQAQFMADDKLRRHLRRKPKSDQARILIVWDKFTAGRLTQKEIL